MCYFRDIFRTISGLKMFLVYIFGALLPVSLLTWLIILMFSFFREDAQPIYPGRWMIAVLLPILIASWGLKKKSLDKSGALTALLVGFCLTISNMCFCSSLLAFFITASKATKYKAMLKKKFEEEFKEGGQRNWVQVICNGCVPSLFAILYMINFGCLEDVVDFSKHYLFSWYIMAVLGAIACSCGDTYASELGTVVKFNTSPRLITTFRQVPKGTNGGISLMGTIFSGVGGFVVGVAFYLTLILSVSEHRLSSSPAQWPIILVATIAGFLGSAIDSYLGALCQYSGYDREKKCIVERPGDNVDDISGYPVFDNHSVNLLSSLFTGLLTPSIAFIVWEKLFEKKA
ncbi:hypothetical protein KUTeg_008437 [Tegillarca granosa]|uniref:Transmembrane protein 19 n=1 Tax=Tegillarca granosa TaxID=220873 RepID=A0ABQ9FBC0_TEGGR|nr:hypothetical protein KUTeg_008437 [Tegillarca granosa]